MGGGHVLEFTVREFDAAVLEATGKNIGDDRYCLEGTSKAKRLRSFWAQEPDDVVGALIQSFVVYAEAFKMGETCKLEVCKRIAERLVGRRQKCEILSEKEFLKEEYPDVRFERLALEGGFVPVMEYRWREAKSCMDAGAHLSVVLLLGSMLEGILLGAAQADPKTFNQSPAAPKDESDKVLPHWKWKLSDLIDTAYSIGALKLDVKKFSHALRDFRNYIHPYEQKASGFSPDQDTARICLQVFRAAVNQLSLSKGNTRGS